MPASGPSALSVGRAAGTQVPGPPAGHRSTGRESRRPSALATQSDIRFTVSTWFVLANPGGDFYS